MRKLIKINNIMTICKKYLYNSKKSSNFAAAFADESDVGSLRR